MHQRTRMRSNNWDNSDNFSRPSMAHAMSTIRCTRSPTERQRVERWPKIFVIISRDIYYTRHVTVPNASGPNPDNFHFCLFAHHSDDRTKSMPNLGATTTHSAHMRLHKCKLNKSRISMEHISKFHLQMWFSGDSISVGIEGEVVNMRMFQPSEWAHRMNCLCAESMCVHLHGYGLNRIGI